MSASPVSIAKLDSFGLLAASGADVRTFLHAQLTNDVEHLPQDRARFAGWCSAKGRLLASLLVVPQGEDVLLQVSRDIAATTAKRLAMFILRAKVKLADRSAEYVQYGVWGSGAAEALAIAGLPIPGELLASASSANGLVVRLEEERFLVLSQASPALIVNAPEEAWTLAEIRAGRPSITQATQDEFVPQMTNLQVLGGVDFKKGCYPGQEIVARTQYRGTLKRRMYRVRSGSALRAGQDLYSDDFPGQASGKVVNAAEGEALAVLQIGSVEKATPVRAEPGGQPLEVLPLPYAL